MTLMLRRMLVSTLVIGVSVRAIPHTQADVIRLLYDRVQLSTEITWTNPPLTGSQVFSLAAGYDGPGLGTGPHVAQTGYPFPPGTFHVDTF